MKTKIERATEIHRTMTPHQMALRIAELQDALELAEEAVRAKPPAAPVVPEGWQLVPCGITYEMLLSWVSALDHRSAYQAMLAAAPKPVAAATYLDGDPK